MTHALLVFPMTGSSALFYTNNRSKQKWGDRMSKRCPYTSNVYHVQKMGREVQSSAPIRKRHQKMKFALEYELCFLP